MSKAQEMIEKINTDVELSNIEQASIGMLLLSYKTYLMGEIARVDLILNGVYSKDLAMMETIHDNNSQASEEGILIARAALEKWTKEING